MPGVDRDLPRRRPTVVPFRNPLTGPDHVSAQLVDPRYLGAYDDSDRTVGMVMFDRRHRERELNSLEPEEISGLTKIVRRNPSRFPFLRALLDRFIR